jgi:hypothetical protein
VGTGTGMLGGGGGGGGNGGGSPTTLVSPSRPQRGSAKRSPTRLRYRMPTSPSASAGTSSGGGGVAVQIRATPPSSPSKRQLKEIAGKDKNGAEGTVDPIWIARKGGGLANIKFDSVKERGQENENSSRDGEKEAALSKPLGLFQKFDTERTGFLTRKQFADMMVHLGLSFSSDDDLLVDAEMAMLADERDRVSFEQWKGWYGNLPER